MKLLLGGWAFGTLFFAFGLMAGKKGNEFTLFEAGAILALSLIPGLLFGIAAWGLL